MILAATCVFVLGAALGAVVTQAVRDRDPWSRRLGRTRLRRANLPVGGSVLLLVSAVVALAGAGPEATLLAALGVGAAVQAPVLGLLDPLPPERRRPARGMRGPS